MPGPLTRSSTLLLAGWFTVQTVSGQPSPSATHSPRVSVLKAPDFFGQEAIWGATGFDRQGHIYFGMTSSDPASGSAHLFELDPVTGTFSDRGNVLSELQRLGLKRPAETQMKIHSRIVESPDGFQYFASMDEQGEAPDGSRLPTWGGHLWRRGRSGTWEHLTATPQALIAVAIGGPYVYALGYFDHVLFQFDTRSSRIRSVTVGSVGGHVSRNFFADDRGHVFVPRTSIAAGAAQAALVDFDPDLKEVKSEPLTHYFESSPADSHGIVGTVPDGSGGWYFTTPVGRLYHQQRAATGFTLDDLGWFHPSGSRYTASLFRNDKTGTLYTVAAPSHNGSATFEWIVRSANGQTSVAPLPYGDTPQFPGGALIYGSMTHDQNGRFYAVGTMAYKPVILQITPAVDGAP